MAQTRKRNRGAGASKKRSKKLVNSGRGKEAVRVVALGKKPKTSAKTNPRSIEKRVSLEFFKWYSAGAKKAKKVGQPVRFTVEVLPDGSAKAIGTPVTIAPPNVSSLETSLKSARERGTIKIAEILKGEDMLTAGAFGSLIGASHETVNVRRGRGEILGLQGATRGVRYPSWQVTESGMPLPGLSELFEILGKQPWSVYRFLKTEHAELGGRTALEAMKAGQQKAVLGVAKNQMIGVVS
ncbi:hypothetical protein [Rhodopseudomonas palustris]|uniref:hypothetical protein n=1 Tax=Rhodopseudomonas palustris TaxID=1076 RepID=UPI0014027297|nr:hypothetical protein [Rhodopseudomonas palustris]QLH69220.1 hypothetical protein HZF03_13960 [Rhodopseudomonas palustris]